MDTPHFEALRTAYWCILAFLVAALFIGFRRLRSAAATQNDASYLPAHWRDAVLIALLGLVTGLPYLAGQASSPTGDGAPVSITTGQVVAGSFLQTQFVVCVLIYLRFVRQLSPTLVLGLQARPVLQVISIAFSALVVAVIAMQLAMVAWWQFVLGEPLPLESDQDVVEAFQSSQDVALRLAIALAAGLVAPITEEVVYRGIIFGFGRQFMGFGLAALLSSALFAVVHVDAVASLPLFVLGLSFAFAYQFTGSLWVPMAMHLMFNVYNLLSMLWMPPPPG